MEDEPNDVIIAAALGQPTVFQMHPWMASMSAEVYVAHMLGYTPGEAARKAAIAVAEFENELAQIRVEMSQIRAEGKLTRWMVTLNIALNSVILAKLFLP